TASASIQQVAPRVVARGAPIPFKSAGERDVYPAVRGDLGWVGPNLYGYTGAAWRLVSGSEVTNTAPGSGTTGWFGASDVPSLGSQVTITANHFDCSLRLRRGTGGVIAVDGNGLIAGGPIDVFTIGA